MVEQWVFIRLPRSVLDCSRGWRAAKRSRALTLTQRRRRSDDGGEEKRTSFLSFAHREGKIIFVVVIGQDIMGRINYSSLDEDMQKTFAEFCKRTKEMLQET
jgi:hypothetical protein